MELTRAFGIRQKEVVSFVGGGGKTTAMFRLAEELVERGKRVVTTTTTRIFAAQIKLAPFHIRAESNEQWLRDLRAALKEHSHVLVVGMTNEEGKAFGVGPTVVDRIAALDEVDVVINEGDGSRMRPFKAPGDHEPVIPVSTTLLVPVAGMDAIGAPLDNDHVHRAERVAELAGVKVGTIIEPELIAKVIANEQGGLKNRPPQARVIPLINKAQNVAQLLIGRAIARQLLRNDSMDAVAIGTVKNAVVPVAEVHRRVAAIVLAAGGSTRMQGPLKQLLPWGGSTLVCHTLDVVNHAQVAEIIVVVGKRGEEVRRALAAGPSFARCKIVHNPDWEEGRSTSVRAGLKATNSTSAAAVFVNADQPFLTANVIDTILHRYYQTLAPIVIPVYDGVTGSPVMFGRELFDELMRLTGEEGGKQILNERAGEAEKVNLVNVRAACDLDTMEQYNAALAEAEANPSEGIVSTVPSNEE
jgi:molybdenum cofactor cytidylyltransferase